MQLLTPFQASCDRPSSWSDLLSCLLSARAPRPDRNQSVFNQKIILRGKRKESSIADDSQAHLHLLHRNKSTCQVREQVILEWEIERLLNHEIKLSWQKRLSVFQKNHEVMISWWYLKRGGVSDYNFPFLSVVVAQTVVHIVGHLW